MIKKITMYSLISKISERCRLAAEKRGKDTSWISCIYSLREELAEYWSAKDDARETSLEAIRTTEQIQDDAEFIDAYEKTLHNTVADELADMLIVAATWNASADANNSKDFKPERDVEVMLASGVIFFICGQISGPRDVEMLRCMVNLKMRFNELRKD